MKINFTILMTVILIMSQFTACTSISNSGAVILAKSASNDNIDMIKNHDKIYSQDNIDNVTTNESTTLVKRDKKFIIESEKKTYKLLPFGTEYRIKGLFFNKENNCYIYVNTETKEYITGNFDTKNSVTINKVIRNIDFEENKLKLDLLYRDEPIEFIINDYSIESLSEKYEFLSKEMILDERNLYFEEYFDDYVMNIYGEAVGDLREFKEGKKHITYLSYGTILDLDYDFVDTSINEKNMMVRKFYDDNEVKLVLYISDKKITFYSNKIAKTEGKLLTGTDKKLFDSIMKRAIEEDWEIE